MSMLTFAGGPMGVRFVVVTDSDAGAEMKQVSLAYNQQVQLDSKVVAVSPDVFLKLSEGRLALVSGVLPAPGVSTSDGVIGSDDISTSQIADYIVSTDAILQFFSVNGPAEANVYNGPKEGTSTLIGVTNGVGVLDPFNSESSVEIVVTGGTSANPKLNGEDSPCLVTLVNGVATVVVSADDAGTVLLGLANGNTDLNRDDVATVNLS